MEDPRRGSLERLNGSLKATHELVVIVGIENVVLAVVLCLHNRVRAGEVGRKQVRRSLALAASSIGEPSPGEISVGDVLPRLPATLIDERL